MKVNVKTQVMEQLTVVEIHAAGMMGEEIHVVGTTTVTFVLMTCAVSVTAEVKVKVWCMISKESFSAPKYA